MIAIVTILFRASKEAEVYQTMSHLVLDCEDYLEISFGIGGSRLIGFLQQPSCERSTSACSNRHFDWLCVHVVSTHDGHNGFLASPSGGHAALKSKVGETAIPTQCRLRKIQAHGRRRGEVASPVRDSYRRGRRFASACHFHCGVVLRTQSIGPSARNIESIKGNWAVS